MISLALRSPIPRRREAPAIVTALLLLGLAGCGSDNKSGGTMGTGAAGASGGAGSGGSSGMGTAGSGGTAAQCPPASAPADMISDFDSPPGTLDVLVTGPRGGTMWNAIGDGSMMGEQAVTASPIPGRRCGSDHALKFYGGNHGNWGALARAQFSTMPPYDATAYTGIRFFARASMPMALGVKLADRNTTSTARVCTKCGDHFGVDINLTTDWQTFTIPFPMMKQRGTGDPLPAAVSKEALYYLEFVVSKFPTFEVWIDDISFVK